MRAGLAREVVRLVQEARKNSGFEVSDRIALRWYGRRRDRRGARASTRDLVADEVLATGESSRAGAVADLTAAAVATTTSSAWRSPSSRATPA